MDISSRNKSNKSIFKDKIFFFFFRHLAATMMSENTFDNTILRKGSLANILATPTVRQMAKELHYK